MSKFFALKFPKVRIEWPGQDAALAPSAAPADKTAPASETAPDTASASTDMAATPETFQRQPESSSPKKKRFFRKTNTPADAKPRQRPFLVRMLSLKVGQALNLILWCVIVGAVMRLTNFNPLHPGVNAGDTAGNIWQQGLAALGWMIRTGWRPALTGASLVLPIWLSWRIITLPFRK